MLANKKKKQIAHLTSDNEFCRVFCKFSQSLVDWANQQTGIPDLGPEGTRRSGAPHDGFLLKAQKYVLGYPEYFYTSRNAF